MSCVVYYKIFTTDINLIHIHTHVDSHSQKKECNIISLAQKRFLFKLHALLYAPQWHSFINIFFCIHLAKMNKTKWSFYQIDSDNGLQYIHWIRFTVQFVRLPPSNALGNIPKRSNNSTLTHHSLIWHELIRVQMGYLPRNGLKNWTVPRFIK